MTLPKYRVYFHDIARVIGCIFTVLHNVHCLDFVQLMKPSKSILFPWPPDFCYFLVDELRHHTPTNVGDV